ncbi:MAG: PhzF family phenazine biosynthesis protein [Alphaproteobacteria bacterium]|nr:PhzF family phenazine biosynthesis protein [Alphaproteobacteria bacterium]
MDLPLFQIDAFTGRVFGGNPAAVCPLERWLPDATLQAIASENNLSETAFFVPEGADYRLRWFTPATEVDLCGHATLATAALILDRLEPGRAAVRFHTRSGVLEVARAGEMLAMDFPSLPAAPVALDPQVSQALGAAPVELLRAERDYLAVFETEAQVKALAPDLAALRTLARPVMIATAPGTDVDFVSRSFAPALGVPEDPATGSTHCTLTPYWAARLGKTALRARQVSQRGGELECVLSGARVTIKGRTAFYLEGRIHV